MKLRVFLSTWFQKPVGLNFSILCLHLSVVNIFPLLFHRVTQIVKAKQVMVLEELGVQYMPLRILKVCEAGQ